MPPSSGSVSSPIICSFPSNIRVRNLPTGGDRSSLVAGIAARRAPAGLSARPPRHAPGTGLPTVFQCGSGARLDLSAPGTAAFAAGAPPPFLDGGFRRAAAGPRGESGIVPGRRSRGRAGGLGALRVVEWRQRGRIRFFNSAIRLSIVVQYIFSGASFSSSVSSFDVQGDDRSLAEQYLRVGILLNDMESFRSQDKLELAQFP